MLADLHYSKAVTLFQLLKDTPCELLRVQLERVAFAEFQMAGECPLPGRAAGGGLVPAGWLGLGGLWSFRGGEECRSWVLVSFPSTVTLGRDQKSLHLLKCFFKLREMG